MERKNLTASSGLTLLAGFFGFGTLMCLLTLVGLLSPGGVLEPMWRLNPEARVTFQAMGNGSLLLMTIVGLACGFAAVGLIKRMSWGRYLALGVLIVNLLGDLGNALLRHDWRTLLGLPISGMLIAYLCSQKVRRAFSEPQLRTVPQRLAQTPSQADRDARSK